ncbi:HPr family phosphocarrier protein [Glycomyces sp. TRM65418]|uniref:HPr family phosphocarrier protein n=1 Tax=Glycomyces sp. TRM65418 TaxID=2867006 RepID=UPI001CE5C10B|nr:HPr family phosphocarrier protein [Glycomyces sp. TRM65418]MCC3762700.1 HPr family phosphocarrier protein [Glycomyces sp. TRM65418]QZD56735.1 HPr family phosphocarrier protein [Glycomyces sp. TRM65418]
MAKRRVTVSTEVGIQARPATVFVDTASESRADVTIAKPGGDAHDAKSILQVLTLDVRSGDEIVLAGEDEEILDRLVALVTGAADTGGVDISDIDEQ